MSAVTEPYRSELSAGRDGLAQPLHAEWTKFRTARGLIVGAMLAILVMVLLSLIGPLNSHSTIANPSGISVGHPYVPTGPDGEAVTDSFYFVHQPLAGNGTVTVRLSSLTGHIVLPNGRTEPGLEPWAKAGVIVKENTEQGSPYAAVMVTGAHGVRLQYDYTHDIGSDPASQVALAAPRWLRLMRSGDLLTGYESSDGIHWRSVGSAHLAGLPRTVQAGLFVASPPHIQTEQHLGGTSGTMQNTLATAVFDHLGVRGNSPSGTWSGTDVGGGASGSPFDAGAYSESNGLYTVSGSGDIAADVSAGPRVESTLRGTFAGLIVVIVLASGFVTAEYRRGLIRTTLTASPRRGRSLPPRRSWWEPSPSPAAWSGRSSPCP
jgi:hypothetical protein